MTSWLWKKKEKEAKDDEISAVGDGWVMKLFTRFPSRKTLMMGNLTLLRPGFATKLEKSMDFKTF